MKRAKLREDIRTQSLSRESKRGPNVSDQRYDNLSSSTNKTTWPTTSGAEAEKDSRIQM